MRKYLLLLFSVFLFGFIDAQTTYAWRSEATSGDWNIANNWWRGFAEVPSGTEILRFDNNVQTSMTNNLTATSRHQIFFDGGASSSRTIGGSSENTFYDYGANKPKIENQSTATHFINFPIKLGYNPLEINPVNGNLTFGGNIDNNGNYIDVYGANSKILEITTDISGSGGLTLKQNSTVKFTTTDKSYTGVTTLDAGMLELQVDLASSTITVKNGATLRITENATINNLTVEIGGQVQVYASKGLTINGNLNNSGMFILMSVSDGSASLITNGTVTGSVIAANYMTNNQRWEYISSPVDLSGTTFDAAFDSGDPIEFYRWDEDYSFESIIGYWIDVRGSSEWTSTTFIPGVGYALSYYGGSGGTPFELVGVPYHTNKTITLLKTTGSTGEGWNLVGNPFPCTLAGNSNAEVTNNFISQNATALDDSYEAMYFWNDVSDYQAISNASAATYIDNGRGFMVLAATNGASLSFNTTIRKHAAGSTIYKAKDETIRFNLAIKNNDGLYNEIQFSFAEGMTKGLDPSYDAGKYEGNPDIGLYSFMSESNGEKFDIQALPLLNEAMSIPVGLRVSQAGNYTFTVSKIENFEPSVPITLEDKLTGDQVDLTINPEYSFMVSEAGTFNERFVLHFKTGVGITEPAITRQPIAYLQNSQLHIKNLEPGNYQVRVSDITGRTVLTSQISSEGSVAMPLSLQTGIYIVEISSETSRFANKIFIQ